VVVAAASVAAATAAPLADAQPARGVAAATALSAPQRPAQPVSAPEPKTTPKHVAKVRPPVAPEPAVKPTPKAPEPRRKPVKPRPPVTTISGYRVCNSAPQPCIDGGSLTLYGQPYGANILAGHNYQGFQWLSQLPVGRRVVVSTGPVAGTYQVTGHMRLNRQGGALPSFGGAALVLQSCEGSGTGFSLLRRIN
jgi:hypothetical protein